MNTEEREAALLQWLEHQGEHACRQILDAAQVESKRLLTEAFHQARSRLHARLLSERRTARERIHAVRAERETRARASGERASVRLLALAWPRLRAALAARWADSESRRRWIHNSVRLACATLPRGQWTIRHPPDWASSERGEVAATLIETQGQSPHFLADGALVAGLVIESAGASLDASLEGLLRDRDRLEARLLALMAGDEAPEEPVP